jgi:hypothetical protein
MFEGWENYYLMIGSSAGALIGLMFVVVTLTAGRDPKELERGKKLYTSPIVWHLAVILVLSGAAAAPVMPVRLFAGIATGLGLLGTMLGIRSAIGISRFFSSTDRAFDAVWYGIAPAVVYVGLVAAGWGMFAGHPWAPAAVGADLMALLLVSIHAEWDLVTYLAPIAGQPLPSDPS